MHGLEADFVDEIAFSYLDIDDPSTDVIKQALGYRYQPHLFLLDGDGNILEQWIGPVTRDQLETAFQEALAGQ